MSWLQSKPVFLLVGVILSLFASASLCPPDVMGNEEYSDALLGLVFLGLFIFWLSKKTFHNSLLMAVFLVISILVERHAAHSVNPERLMFFIHSDVWQAYLQTYISCDAHCGEERFEYFYYWLKLLSYWAIYLLIHNTYNKKSWCKLRRLNINF